MFAANLSMGLRRPFGRAAIDPGSKGGLVASLEITDIFTGQTPVDELAAGAKRVTFAADSAVTTDLAIDPDAGSECAVRSGPDLARFEDLLAGRVGDVVVVTDELGAGDPAVCQYWLSLPAKPLPSGTYLTPP